jgi:hypothetical protein
MTNTNNDSSHDIHPAMHATKTKYQRYLEIANRLSGMLDKIRDDTSFDSHSNGKLSHPHFHELSEMGSILVPFIFHDMTHHGAGWHHLLLLSRITGEHPWNPQHNGNYYAILGSWLLWYVENEHRFDRDIYHGLVAD